MYDTIRNAFMGELDNLLGGSFEGLLHSIILGEQALF